MVHHQWLLEEKEEGLFTHEVLLATLCYALKPSCDCAISQIRYLKGKRKKAAFTAGAALSCPGGVSVKMGAGAVPLPQLQPPPGHVGHHSSQHTCSWNLMLLCQGWIQDDFAQGSFCLFYASAK